jgi:hypothetical protein
MNAVRHRVLQLALGLGLVLWIAATAPTATDQPDRPAPPASVRGWPIRHAIGVSPGWAVQGADSPAPLALPGPTLEVQWKNGRLSVAAERTPLTRILRKVARLTGVEMQGLEHPSEEISVRFTALPLRDALKALLARVDRVVLEETFPRDGTPPLRALIFARRALPASAESRSPEGGEGNDGPMAGERHVERLRAFAAQGNLGELQKAVFDQDQAIQHTAFELLAQQDPQQALATLLLATKSDHPATRLHALHLLQGQDQLDEGRVQSALGDVLADDDVTVRIYAVQALSLRSGPAALQYLRQALHDPEPVVREVLVESVAQNEEHHQLLRELLSERDDRLRSLALFWLTRATEGR